MELSYFLAKVMGLYFIIISIAFLLNRDALIAAASELMNSYALRLVLYIFTLILGILLIVSHNVWTTNFAVLVTIVGWLIFIKGAINLMFPAIAKDMGKPFLKSKPLITGSILINLLLGLIFIYYGFFSQLS